MLSGDLIVFICFEAFYFAIVLYAVYYAILEKLGKPRPGAKPKVRRGEESWQGFYLFYGIASFILIHIISVVKGVEDYKVILSILNLGALLYLSFYNSWSRNKIILLIVRSKMKEEG